MNIFIYGGAGFIGTNLVNKLAQNKNAEIRVVDKKKQYFKDIEGLKLTNVECIEDEKFPYINFERLMKNTDIVYHLMSTSMPSNTNSAIADEIVVNISASLALLDACVKKQVNKVVFISSGGTVYGKTNHLPIREEEQNFPITTYGIQKLTIEKILYLYWHLYGLDYRIIRLANPYGKFQRPNGALGVITTFTYCALAGKKICIYGDGSIVRDYIYIDDAVRAIINIVNSESKYKLFNVGSGKGRDINSIIAVIKNMVGRELEIENSSSRQVDVPVNILDVSRYEKIFGKCAVTSLEEGISYTRDYLLSKYF